MTSSGISVSDIASKKSCPSSLILSIGLYSGPVSILSNVSLPISKSFIDCSPCYLIKILM